MTRTLTNHKTFANIPRPHYTDMTMTKTKDNIATTPTRFVTTVLGERLPISSDAYQSWTVDTPGETVRLNVAKATTYPQAVLEVEFVYDEHNQKHYAWAIDWPRSVSAVARGCGLSASTLERCRLEHFGPSTEDRRHVAAQQVAGARRALRELGIMVSLEPSRNYQLETAMDYINRYIAETVENFELVKCDRCHGVAIESELEQGPNDLSICGRCSRAL